MIVPGWVIALSAIAVVIGVGARSLALRGPGPGKDRVERERPGASTRDQTFFDREFFGIASRLGAVRDERRSLDIDAVVQLFGEGTGLLRAIRPTAAPGTVSLTSETGELRLRLSSPYEAARLCDVSLPDGLASYTLTVGTDGAQIVIVTPHTQIAVRGEILTD